MEIQEKRVLRRKQLLLASVIEGNGQFLPSCVTKGLLSAEQLRQLQGSNDVMTEQVISFLTILEQGPLRTNFARLSYALENADLTDAADEIQVELMSEKKRLTPPDILVKEARLMTNKLFTGHRCLTPSDADEVGALLVDRYMVAAEIGRRRLSRYRLSVVKGQGGLLHSIAGTLAEVTDLIKEHFADAMQDDEEKMANRAIEETPGECSETPGECSVHRHALSLLSKRVKILVGCIEEMAVKHEEKMEQSRAEKENEEDENINQRIEEESEEDEEEEDDDEKDDNEEEDIYTRNRRNGMEKHRSGSRNRTDSGHHSGSGGQTEDDRLGTADEVALWRRKVSEKEIVIAELLRTLHESRHVEEALRDSSTALRQHCGALEKIKAPKHQLQCDCSLCERHVDISKYECTCTICRMRRLAFDGSGR